MTPKQKRQPDQRNEQPQRPGDMLTLDPDFDDLDQANAEFCTWRFPDRERGE